MKSKLSSLRRGTIPMKLIARTIQLLASLFGLFVLSVIVVMMGAGIYGAYMEAMKVLGAI